VRDFQPENFVERKEIKKMGRFIQFAIAASEFATSMAGLKVTAEDTERVGVYIGSGIGGLNEIEEQHAKLFDRGPSRVSPLMIPKLMVNAAGAGTGTRAAPSFSL
jgi:3-oxoacyl-[acyl-carrier-protein] synthase II